MLNVFGPGRDDGIRQTEIFVESGIVHTIDVIFDSSDQASLRKEVTRYPKNLEGADSRPHLPPGVQQCSARAARLQLPESRGPIRTAVRRVQ